MSESRRLPWMWMGLLGLFVVFGIVGWVLYRALSTENAIVRTGTHAGGTFQELLLNEVLHAKEFDRPADPAQRDKSDRDFSRLAATYYHRDGPLGRVMERYNWFPGPTNTYGADARLPASVTALLARSSGPMPVEALAQLWTEPPIAVIFVQAHAIASYARPFQCIDFFEPNPKVADFFRPNYPGRSFQQMHEAHLRGAHVNVVVGDELEMLKAGPQKFYRVIVVENGRGQKYLYRYFKNHVTPAAMTIYDQALAEDGVICFHTSSRHDNISGDVVAVASNFGWSALRGLDTGDRQRERDAHFGSEWVIVSRRPENLQFLNLPPPPAGKDGIRWQMK